MNAGKLNQQICILIPIDEPDGQGGFRRSWKKDKTVWGEVVENEPMLGTVVGKEVLLASYKVKIRKQDYQISGLNCLEWRGRRLEIVDFSDYQSKKRPPYFWTLTCKEVRA